MIALISLLRGGPVEFITPRGANYFPASSVSAQACKRVFVSWNLETNNAVLRAALLRRNGETYLIVNRKYPGANVCEQLEQFRSQSKRQQHRPVDKDGTSESVAPKSCGA